ncbi:hypothetical protein BDN67DRAFT_985395 [Paxillus ammoniavirescens]|nr:hypothetical protein BDN67DRAFT_985395 [Paxillus ammoniavirescens]
MGRPKLHHTEDDVPCKDTARHIMKKTASGLVKETRKTTANDKTYQKGSISVPSKKCRNAECRPSAYSSSSPLHFKTLRITLARVEDIEGRPKSLHAEVLQEKGVGDELQRVEVTLRWVKHVAHALEDIILHGVSEPSDALLKKKSHKELYYQASLDIVPLSTM